MNRDPLIVLSRIRKMAVDDAEKEVAQAYQYEQQAIIAVRSATEALELEMREATSLVAGDDSVEAFARWLPIGRRKIADAYTRQLEATTHLDQVRTVLLLARAAVEVVEKRIQDKLAHEADKRQRREQVVLDDFGSRR